MFENWQIDKKNFETYLDPDRAELPISDQVWENIIEDVEHKVAEYLEETLREAATQYEEGNYDY